MNKTPMSRAIVTIVWLACFDSGGLKMGTPLLIDSTPVRAVQPAEKVCRIKKRVTGPVGVGAVSVNEPGPSTVARTMPTTIMTRYIARKKYTGTVMIAPDSRKPRKLARVTIVNKIKDKGV